MGRVLGPGTGGRMAAENGVPVVTQQEWKDWSPATSFSLLSNPTSRSLEGSERKPPRLRPLEPYCVLDGEHRRVGPHLTEVTAGPPSAGQLCASGRARAQRAPESLLHPPPPPRAPERSRVPPSSEGRWSVWEGDAAVTAPRTLGGAVEEMELASCSLSWPLPSCHSGKPARPRWVRT